MAEDGYRCEDAGESEEFRIQRWPADYYDYYYQLDVAVQMVLVGARHDTSRFGRQSLWLHLLSEKARCQPGSVALTVRLTVDGRRLGSLLLFCLLDVEVPLLPLPFVHSLGQFD